MNKVIAVYIAYFGSSLLAAPQGMVSGFGYKIVSICDSFLTKLC